MKKLMIPVILLLVLSLLCGCGGAPGTGGEDASSAPAAAKAEEKDAAEDAAKLDFSTVDINGDPYTAADMKDAKVVLVNFWEPWCGPCVGEMGDLEKLYEEYKDKGLLIIGAYSTEGMDEDVRSVISENGVTYPVIKAAGNMGDFMTNYVPTSVFADGEGYILTDEPVVGANSYDDWKVLIEAYLYEA